MTSSGWLSPAAGRRILVGVLLLLALFVGFDAYRQTGDWAFTLRLAGMAVISVWLVYRLALWTTRLLRR